VEIPSRREFKIQVDNREPRAAQVKVNAATCPEILHSSVLILGVGLFLFSFSTCY